MEVLSFNKFNPFKNPTSANQSSNGKASHVIQDTPEKISKYVYDDIQLLKQEIKSYNEITNVFANRFYYKIYKLIETNQTRELTTIKQSCNYQFDYHYYKKVVAFYKNSLQEYQDFLHLIQYNFNNGLLTTSSSISLERRLSNIDPSKVDESVPEDLIDPLSLELFTDPVISPSGITYEKSLILDHFFKNGQYDPLTKEPLSASQLYPNLAIKNSINRFLSLKGG